MLNLVEHVKSFITSGPVLGAYANSSDPVQMLQGAASELGLHVCLQGFLCKIQ